MLRNGALLLIYPAGDETPRLPLGRGLFHVGDEAETPERLRFDAIAGRQTLRATLSGCPYYRFFTP